MHCGQCAVIRAALCVALRDAPSGPCLPAAEVVAAGGVCAATGSEVGAEAAAAAVAAQSATAAAHPEAAGSDLRAQCDAQ